MDRGAQDGPFFVYLPHATPGSTRTPYVAERFQGKSKNGLWGDSVEELDWSTGEIMAALKRLGIDENTLVVWTSDNGAPRRNPPQGSNEPLKGWGYSTSEGGMRVPCIVRWPGHVPAGTVCGEPCLTIDLLPTFAELAGTHAPARSDYRRPRHPAACVRRIGSKIPARRDLLLSSGAITGRPKRAVEAVSAAREKAGTRKGRGEIEPSTAFQLR